jgi:gliding motility-associated-like protein
MGNTLDEFRHELKNNPTNLDRQALLLSGPFSCTTEFYFTLFQDFSVLDPNNMGGGLQVLFTLPNNVNATGYNPLDNYIYTISSGSANNGNPLRIHSDGTIEDLGDIGLGISPFVGGFDPSGLWYVKDGSSFVYIIDLTTMSFTTQALSQNFAGADWAFHQLEEKFYGVSGTTLYSFDPVTYNVQTFALTGISPGDGSTFGAAFYNSDGFIYVYNNNSGNIYQINVNTYEAAFVYQTEANSNNVDGCACPNAPPPIPVVIANPDTFCVDPSGYQSYFIIENDEIIFAEFDLSSFSLISPPLYGSIDYDDSTGEIIYTAFGTPQEDSFVYEICSEGSTVVCDQTTVYVTLSDEVSFNPIGPFCLGEYPDDLPEYSNEGFEGSWEPPVINTGTSGNYIYTFTPDPDQYDCAFPTDIEIEIIQPYVGSFEQINPYCQFDEPDDLPEVSLEGYFGTWNPAIVNTSVSGVYTYIFTPDETLHPCALESYLTITINPTETPTFDQLGPFCTGENPGDLPENSIEYINGTWDPSTINTDIPGDYIYIFTPDISLHPCAYETSVAISIVEEAIPTFDQLGPYCVGAIPEELPFSSIEGYIGSWTPDTIETNVPGGYEFVFIPDPDSYSCVDSTILVVQIDSAIVPTFNYTPYFCLNENAAELPANSLEGIPGTWSPTQISTDEAGTNDYIFTPDISFSSCAVQTSIHITTLPEIEINIIDKICSADLLTYDIIIEVTGGTGSYDSLYAQGKQLVFNGNGQYTILGVASAQSIEITVWDDFGCTAFLVTIPFNCNCPDIAVPGGNEYYEYCDGEYIDSIWIMDYGSGLLINWYDENGDLLSHENPYLPPGPGTYFVTLQEIQSGCESKDPLEITVAGIPAIIIDTIDINCAENLQSYFIEFSVSGGSGEFVEISANNHQVSATMGGTYLVNDIPLDSIPVTISVIDDSGCTASLIIPAHYCNCPLIPAPSGEQLFQYCFEDQVPVLSVNNDTPDSEILWFNSQSVLLSKGTEFQPSSPGLYYTQITDTINNCSSELFEIELIRNDEILVSSSTEICENETGQYDLLLNVSGGTPGYTIQAGNKNVLSTTLHEYIIQSLTGTSGINVLIVDKLGCETEFLAKPSLLPVPDIELDSEAFISCYDSSALLQVTVDPQNYSFNWSGPDNYFNQMIPSPIVKTSGLYKLTVTDSVTGCQIVDSIRVHEAVYPDFDVSIVPINCYGGNDGIINFFNFQNGNPPFLYSIDGGITFSGTPIFSDISPGNYDLTIKDNLGCQKDSFVYLVEPAPLELIIEPFVSLSLGESHQIDVETNLSPEAIQSIRWWPSEGLSCTDCLEPVMNPLENTSYFLEIYDTLGCSIMDSVLVSRENDIGIYIPNVFSPNEDGINDMFFIKAGKSVEVVVLLRIYDRWGNIIYENTNFPPNDPAFGWDGHTNSLYVNPGVYVYMTELRYTDGESILLVGDITVIK